MSNFDIILNLRCPCCFNIPLINLYTFKNELKIKFNCINKNCLKQYDNKYKKLINEDKKNLINNFLCLKCNTKINTESKENNFYYCYSCYKLLCKDCYNFYENKNIHNIIDIKTMDSICLIHKNPFCYYCTNHKINFCDKCKDNDENNFIKIKNLEYCEKSKYNDIIINNEKNLDEIYKLFNKFKMIIKKFENIYNNFLENERIKINFMKKLLEYYNQFEKKNIINYQILKNIDNNINTNNYIINIINYKINKQIENLKEINTIITNSNTKFKTNETYKFINNNNNNKTIFNENFKFEKMNKFKTINNNKEDIYCLQILNDGRLGAGDSNSNLIIYDKETFIPDLIIPSDVGCISHFIQLKNKNIVSAYNNYNNYCLKIIKIINKKQYEIVQNINNAHLSNIKNILELKNENLVTFSCDNSFKIWKLNKKNNKYQQIFGNKEKNWLYNGIEIKDNEILYDIYPSTLVFYNYINNKKISTIDNLNLTYGYNGIRIIKLNNEEVIIAGNKKIYLIDINIYQIINEIYTYNINICIVKLSNELFLIGDYNGSITQYRIKKKKIIKESSKNNVHVNWIFSLAVTDDTIISGGNDSDIIIWKK